jgi:hypothetical protein
VLGVGTTAADAVAGAEVRVAATTRARVLALNTVAGRFFWENNSMKFCLS